MDYLYNYNHPNPSNINPSPSSTPKLISSSCSSSPSNSRRPKNNTTTTNNNNNKRSTNNPNKGNNNNNNNKNKGSVVKLSTDPQSVAARERRHRISDRFKILQSMVPGGAKLDTVSMLEQAIQYVKFLKAQIWLHQAIINNNENNNEEIYDQDNNDNNNRTYANCYTRSIDAMNYEQYHYATMHGNNGNGNYNVNHQGEANDVIMVAPLVAASTMVGPVSEFSGYQAFEGNDDNSMYYESMYYKKSINYY